MTSATCTTRLTPSTSLGVVQEETGDYPAAAASQQQALALFRDLGHRLGQAHALNDLGLVQQQTGDYPAAAASHQQALALFGDLGNLLGQAEALNRLGELSLRTSATAQARDQHTQALAIARDISAAPEEARALEGIGNSHLQEGNPGHAVAHLQQALTIYQRIGAPAPGACRKPSATRPNRHLHPATNNKSVSRPRACQAEPRRPSASHRHADLAPEQNDHSCATKTTDAIPSPASIGGDQAAMLRSSRVRDWSVSGQFLMPCRPFQ